MKDDFLGSIIRLVFMLALLTPILAIAGSSPSYVYEKSLATRPVVEEVFVKADCKIVYNKTTDSSVNVCNPDYFEKVISGYETFEENVRVIGVVKDGVVYSGDSNIEGGVAYVWSYPVGQRDMRLFGRCRAYEIEKGVCRVIK